ncbi:hypothetical protein SFR_0447 [Streptomyces sp. FR-008]|nr:hypothetical protein SFR_0447 [Streptomyces sp. FR-008]
MRLQQAFHLDPGGGRHVLPPVEDFRNCRNGDAGPLGHLRQGDAARLLVIAHGQEHRSPANCRPDVTL